MASKLVDLNGILPLVPYTSRPVVRNNFLASLLFLLC